MAERIAGDFASRLQEVEAAARRVGEQADEAGVHDLRVAIRRLNAALRLWRPLLRDRARRRARRDLRRIRRALGPIRELEVDVALLRKLTSDLPGPPRVAAEDLLVRLDRRLGRARVEARRSAAQARLLRLRRAIETASERLPERLAREGDPLRSATTLARAAHLEARTALAAALERGSDEALHEARIRVKKLRYALEGLGAVSDQSIPVDGLRDLQRALGDAHDHALLRDRVARRVRRLRQRDAVVGAAALLAVLERIEQGRDAAVAETAGLAARLGPELGVSVPAPVRALPAAAAPSPRPAERRRPIPRRASDAAPGAS